MRRLAILAAALAVGVAVPAVRASSGPSYVFGWTGGNIMPSSVTVAADGVVSVKGPAKPSRSQVSARQLAAVWQTVQARRFFSLRSANCAGALPDFASEFVTVRTATRARTVRVHGDCSPRFAAVYKALKTAVGLR